MVLSQVLASPRDLRSEVGRPTASFSGYPTPLSHLPPSSLVGTDQSCRGCEWLTWICVCAAVFKVKRRCQVHGAPCPKNRMPSFPASSVCLGTASFSQPALAPWGTGPEEEHSGLHEWDLNGLCLPTPRMVWKRSGKQVSSRDKRRLLEKIIYLAFSCGDELLYLISRTNDKF